MSKTHKENTEMKIRKRDGSTALFDREKIENAVLKALKVTAEGGESEARKVATAVVGDVRKEVKKDENYIPTVEEIQDLVEKELILHKFANTAKSYILYRE